MIIIFLILVILLIALIRFDLRGHLSRWLVASIFGLLLAIFCLIVYSVNMWDFSYFVRKVLLLNNRSLYFWVYYLNLSAFTVIRLLNLGIATFLYCSAVFSFAYFHYMTYSQKKGYKLKLLIFPVFFLLTFDPLFTNAVYHLFFLLQIKLFSANHFFRLIDILTYFNKIWMIGYLVLALGMIWRSLQYAYHDQIRQKTLMLLTNLLTLYLSFSIIFYWVPRLMFTPRGLGLTARMYAKPYVGLNLRFIGSTGYYLLISFIAVSSTFFLVSIYKYNVISQSRRRQRQFLETTYKSANIGSQAFIHAFKNDLFAIQTLASKGRAGDQFSKENFESIHTVSSTCLNRLDHLHKMTSKPRMNLTVELIPSIVSEIKGEVAPFIPENITLSLAPHMRDLSILVDRSQLIEVMRNLITNSCESIGQKRGTILITAYQKGRWGVIAIEDNGAGISKANLKKIFNPYYSTKPSTKNWGLGLSYCQQIIQMMDGDILVKSEEGKGSTFSIYLSLAEH